MKEKREFSKEDHWSENMVSVHYARENNMPRECHFMNSTSLKVISSSVSVTTVINGGDSTLIEFRIFHMRGIANI